MFVVIRRVGELLEEVGWYDRGAVVIGDHDVAGKHENPAAGDWDIYAHGNSSLCDA